MSYTKIDNTSEINRFIRTVNRSGKPVSSNSYYEQISPPDYMGRFSCTNYYNRKCRRNFNTAPELDLVDFLAIYTEHDPSTLFLGSATVTDVDDTTLASITMVGGGSFGADTTDEILTFDTWSTDSATDHTDTLVVGTTTFSLAYTSSNYTLVVTKSGGGTFPIEDGQDLIRLFEYQNTAIPPTEGDRTFDWTANDGTDDSLVASLTLTVEQMVETYRVRRTSDSTEANYDLVEVDDGTLDTFVGAGDGCVTTWFDASGNGNDVVQATTTLQPKVAISGVVQEGVVFDGTDDRLSLGARLTTQESSLTVAAFVKVASNGNMCFAGEFDATTNKRMWFLGIITTTNGGADNKLAARVSADGGVTNMKSYHSATSITDGSWHHVAMVYTGGTLLVYVDGAEEVPTKVNDGTVASFFDSDATMRIGYAPAGVPFWLSGAIDSVGVWESALTAPNIATLAAGGEVGSPLLWLKGNYPSAYDLAQTVYQRDKSEVYQRDDSLVLERV